MVVQLLSPKAIFLTQPLRDIEYPLREMEEVENEGAYTNDEKRRNLADSEQSRLSMTAGHTLLKNVQSHGNGTWRIRR